MLRMSMSTANTNFLPLGISSHNSTQASLDSNIISVVETPALVATARNVPAASFQARSE
jgi:hypothetical protein